MAIKEDVAHLANGARVSYLDTGAPEGSPIYRTFVFIHGAAHNKFAWEPVLKIIPNGFRGIAYSQRGYIGSTPLTKEEAGCMVPPSQLHRSHVADLAAFIEYCSQKLRVPGRLKDGSGGITTVYWSKGSAAATGLFYFLKHTPSYATVVDKYISSVVLYEPPKSAVFGLEPGDCGHALFWDKRKEPTEDTRLIFAQYVTGFYKNSGEYLANKGGQQVLTYYRSGIIEPNFQEYMARVSELDYIPAILHWFLVDTETGRSEACHEAFREMAKSSLKTVGILWGAEGIPECVEGSWLAEEWLNEEAAKMGQESKARTKQLPGANHYAHFYDPQAFWDAIVQTSS